MTAPRAAQTTFLSTRDFVITPLVEVALLGASGGGAYLLFSAYRDMGWVGFALLAYLLLAGLTLLMLKALRVFFPIKEGIYTPDKNPTEIYAWSLYGFLCIMNLHNLYVTSLLPAPMQTLLLKLMGAQIGKGTIVSGSVGDPHFVSLGSNVVLGQGCALSPHAIVRLGTQQALIIRRIQVDDNTVIGSSSLIFPGVHIHEGAMVNAMSMVAMNSQIGVNEYWSGAPAQHVRTMSDLGGTVVGHK